MGAHHHDHSGHHHHHHNAITNINNAFVVGIILNASFVIVEFLVGYFKSSLSLMSDAGHNLSDVFSLFLSLLVFKMMKVKVSATYTYGYKKSGILASLANAIILVITCFYIIYEGVQRINQPQEIQGIFISITAFVGIIINAVSAFLFFKDKEHDLNAKGAYLHLLSDALVSFGVVVAGVIIYYTKWYWIDTAISFILAAIILYSTRSLLLESIKLSMDGVPSKIKLEEVKAMIGKHKEVLSVHHIHIWAMSSNENALTAHLVLKENDIAKFESVKKEIKHQLAHHNIHHSTFEIEMEECVGGCE